MTKAEEPLPSLLPGVTDESVTIDTLEDGTLILKWFGIEIGAFESTQDEGK